jgi:hypothetical protein
MIRLVIAINLLLVALVLLAALGCSVAWTRLPDPRPDVSRYEVTVTWGTGPGQPDGGPRKP